MTYTELVKRLADIGRPIPILGLRRIERNERSVDLDDLVAIARALQVPPAWLIFPLGPKHEDEIDLLPGVRIPMEPALAWFAGDAEAFHDYFGHGGRNPDTGLYEWYEIPEGIDVNWAEDVRPLWLYRQHRRYVLEWFETFSRPRMAAAEGKPVGEFVLTLAALAEENLRLIRNEMRRLGLPLPRLPKGGLSTRFEPQGGDSGGQED